MGSRIYDRHLPCGCMISSDGGGGVIPCYAEYGDMRKKKDREQLKLCQKSWKDWMKSEDYKKHLKECWERNNDTPYPVEDELRKLVKEKLKKSKNEKKNKGKNTGSIK